jgi:type I site-specific restriction endonuclease
MRSPEELAREKIDALLEQCGWILQNRSTIDLSAGRGIKAIRNLEKSLAANKRRALIQMATGSGKTYTAVNFVYRLIKLAGARRVLFLVDRGNLGDQTLKEFQQFVTPDDGRKFTELYNVQHLQSAQLDRVSRVCISTIQRLYSMLRFLFFWIETRMPQGQFTRGDRQRVVRDDANGDDVYNIDTEISVPMVFPVECEPSCR